ncbi:ROK family protein [Paenibacillus rhizophilus]|uniref:ROK family protein n=1 Tax=Paenibacillus rhizophilus TaxID=1850366 RepID=A0A3N9NX78_9BACL|nr:ROK family protein [Paenibacillus rhizophilus]RQW08275.1 ROK family protein [Paenibacillus rhizophilus]
MEEKTVNIKDFNRNRIYKLLRQKQSLSKQDIAYQLQLSLPTVTQNLNHLLNQNLIANTGRIGNTGGRNAQAFSYINDAKVAIGLDITGNYIITVVVDLSGNIIKINRRRQSFEVSDSYFRILGDIIQEIIKESNLDESKVLGVGIGVPGLITEDYQTVFYGKILDFTGETLQRFAKYIPYPAILINDANAAGFSEMWVTPETKNAFYISLSTNIGGAVYIGNKVFAGENQKSGEIGHMTIMPDGLPCYCGQKGCLEVYCSAAILSNAAGDSLEKFFEQVKEGNPEKVMLWDKYLRYLSIAINNIRLLFDCDIILGGYVGSFMDDHIDTLKKLVAARNTFEDHADFLRICNYKTAAIAAGAALPFIDQFINEI